MNTMRLLVSTPARELLLAPLVSLRFLAEDGWRGVLPGHEPARARVLEGPVRCVEAEPTNAVSWLATEGGVILIDRLDVRILTRWAASAESLARLRELVEARETQRNELEATARAVAARHEIATRRALVALERKISRP